MGKSYYVYIVTNKDNRVLYTGVANDLRRRVYEHQHKLVPGFTQRYNATRLLFFETCSDIEVAIAREKQIKGGSRQDKVQLVNSMNQEWRDLADDILC